MTLTFPALTGTFCPRSEGFHWLCERTVTFKWSPAEEKAFVWSPRCSFSVRGAVSSSSSSREWAAWCVGEESFV